MASNVIGSAVVEVKADAKQLGVQLGQLTKDVEQKAKAVENTFKSASLRFNDSLAKKSISEIETSIVKLRANLEKKIALGAPLRELDALKSSLNKAESAVNTFKQKTIAPAKITIENTAAKMKISEVTKWRDELQSKFDKQVKLNMDVGTLQKTKAQLDAVNNSIAGMEGSTKKTSGIVSELGTMVGGVFALSKAFDFLKSAITRSGDMEGYRTSLKVMLGSTDQAKKRLEELVDFAASTPYEIPEVVGLGNQLQAVGRYSKETMKNLGDLASAAGKPLQQVAGAFAKLASGQKGIAVDMFRDMLITTQDWVKATGKGVSSTGEMLATTEEMMAAIPKIIENKKFSGMMEEQSKTMKGQLANMADAAGQLSTAIGDSMAPFVKSVVSGAIPALGGLKGNVDLIIATVKIAGITFVAYEVVVNGASIAQKAFAISTGLVKNAFKALKLEMASNPLTVMAVVLVAVGAALYELNEAYGNTIENQIKWNEESQKLNETEQKKLSTQIEAKKKTEEVAAEYEKLYTQYKKTAGGSREHKDAEDKLHKILIEQQKLYPGLITDVYDYAGGVGKMKDASQQSLKDVKNLTNELTNQQKTLANLKLANANLKLDEASSDLITSVGTWGAGSDDYQQFRQIDTDLRKGKKPLAEMAQEIDKLALKYSDWATKGGKDKAWNLDKANALYKLLGAINAKRDAYQTVKSGAGVDATNGGNAGGPKISESKTVTGEVAAINEKIEALKKINAEYKTNGITRAEFLANEREIARLEKSLKIDESSGKSKSSTQEALEDFRKQKRELAEIDKLLKNTKSLKGAEKEVQINILLGKQKQLRAEISKYEHPETLGDLSGIKAKGFDRKMGVSEVKEPKDGLKKTKETVDGLIDEEMNAQDATEQFGQSLAGAFSQGIFAAEGLGGAFAELGKNFAGMIVQALAFRLIMMGLKAIPGVGGVLSWLKIGAHSGGDFVGTSSGVMKLAGGGSFTVPNGFPNDSFPLMVETGEKVHVTPASQVNGSSNFNDTNMVTALNKIHSRIVSLEQTTRVVSKRPISLNKKIVTREISSQQNANTRNNVKVS